MRKVFSYQFSVISFGDEEKLTAEGAGPSGAEKRDLSLRLTAQAGSG
jgi:hypothetical protein